MILLLLAGLAVVFAACCACYLAGYGAGRVHGRSEGWDEAVHKHEVAFEALRRVT